ncbi:hypothetical protein NVP1031O_073 [Vibrio phage 1.031.O._10N.261.46.F8]|nr:hypothetical protein NVP1031O_073 [Vibrio phage 1.031.O._10N.261.46.F8]
MSTLNDILTHMYEGEYGTSIPTKEFNSIKSLLVEYESDLNSVLPEGHIRCFRYRRELMYLVCSWYPHGNCVHVEFRPKSKTFIKEIVSRNKCMVELFRWMRRNKQMTYSEVIDFFHMLD